MTNSLLNSHVSVQVVPFGESQKRAYEIIDLCLGLIANSGFKYTISPMETTIEGPYEAVMALTHKIHALCLTETAEVLINLKIHSSATRSITMQEKGLM